MFVGGHAASGGLFFGALGFSQSFSYLVGAVCGATFGIFGLVNREDRLVFPPLQQRRSFRLKATLGGIALAAIQTAAVACAGLWCAGWLVSGVGRYAWPGLPGAIVTAFALGLSRRLYRIVATEAVELGRASPDNMFRVAEHPLGLLLGGLTSGDEGLRHAAFYDLAEVAARAPPTRRFIFLDKAGRSWARIYEACTKPLVDLIAELNSKAGQDQQHLPEQQQPQQQPPFLSRVRGAAVGPHHSAAHASTVPPPDVEATVPSLAMDALSTFVLHSLKEDELGTVQSVLRDTISVLVGVLLAVEANLELPTMVRATQIPRLEGHQFLRTSLLALKCKASTALYRIVTTFYEDLPALRFPPKVAQRLQVIANFEED